LGHRCGSCQPERPRWEYEAFEEAYRQASPIIASSKGHYRTSYTLYGNARTLCFDSALKHWKITIGFRGSDLYQQWRAALVEHCACLGALLNYKGAQMCALARKSQFK
jgi:hypothetical protein